MTTIKNKAAAIATTAALALTGTVAPANASVVDILFNGVSISAGGTDEYSETTTVGNTGEEAAKVDLLDRAPTPMSRDNRKSQRGDGAEEGAVSGEKNVVIIGDEDDNDSGLAAGEDKPITVVEESSNKIWKNPEYEVKAREIAHIINARRAARHEPAMRLDPDMSKAAQNWAESMASTHWFEHDPGNHRHGEIIAMRYNFDRIDTSLKLVEQWEHSPAHAKLMHRSDFHAMGVGIAHDDKSDEVYAVVRLYYS